MARKHIQQLSSSLVNRIAAGEVIERPASVVKELVENSLDAGATHIHVEIEDGGRELIRVIDDGCGIPPDELPLAFAEHATSKITCDDDLFAISTMGFRGEALASIGSVSQARILSRVAENPAAYEIFNRGGEITLAQAAAGNTGTTIEVRNLFYNVPARRKFMKGAPTEIGHISEAVLRIALAYPKIGFKLLHNGRMSMDLSPVESTKRLLEAWPDDFHDKYMAVDARDGELHLTGIVGLPQLAKPTGKYLYFYLNGRHIRDKFIQHAAREAYRGLTEPGRFPAVILQLQVPPGDVDVNVHPTKSEVRFKDSGRIHGLVMSAIREKLLSHDLSPSAIPFTVDGQSTAGFYPGNAIGYAGGNDQVRQSMREKLAAFFKDNPALSENTDAPVLPGLGASATAWQAAVPTAIQSGSQYQSNLAAQSANASTENTSATRTDGENGDAASFSLRADLTGDHSAAMLEPGQKLAASPFLSPSVGDDRAAMMPVRREVPQQGPATAAIQLHNSYLVAQTPEGMVIIDQHALHERVMYEELRMRMLAGPLESQRMLIPLAFAASSRQIAILDQIQPLLTRLGIELSPFGPGTLAIQAFPTFLSRLDPITFMTELLERGEQELLDLHEEEILHEILDMMACKAAVKAGDPLTPGEIEALLARRDLIDRSSNCPHGRPTTLRLTLTDLEKQFKRRGF